MLAQIVYGLDIKQLEEEERNTILKDWGKSSRIGPAWNTAQLRLERYGQGGYILAHNENEFHSDVHGCWNRLDMFDHITLTKKRLTPPENIEARMLSFLRLFTAEPRLICPTLEWHLILSY